VQRSSRSSPEKIGHRPNEAGTAKTSIEKKSSGDFRTQASEPVDMLE
jgi:hypothetical protein